MCCRGAVSRHHRWNAHRAPPRSHVKGNAEQIAVVVGTVTDDKRVVAVPKLKLAALRVTESARVRILKVQRGWWWRW